MSESVVHADATVTRADGTTEQVDAEIRTRGRVTSVGFPGLVLGPGDSVAVKTAKGQHVVHANDLDGEWRYK